MARSILTTADSLLNSSAGDKPGAAGSMGFWFRPNWNGNDSVTHVLWYYTSANELTFQKSSGNLLLAGWNSAGHDDRVNVAATNLFTNGVWRHYLFTWDAASSIVYVNGAQVGSKTTTTTFALQTGELIGQHPGPSSSANGSYAHFARWAVKLDAPAALALGQGANPLSVSLGIVKYKPLFGLGANEADLIDLADPFVATGTTAFLDEPPVLPWPQNEWFDRGIIASAVAAARQFLPLMGCS